MAFDYKKEYKEFYMPKNKPSIVEIPKMNYIAVKGKGNPNEENGDYKNTIGLLYGIAYTIKMSYKGTHKIDGFFEYVVPPLEGFWWQENTEGIDYNRKEDMKFISIIRLPDFVTKEDFEWAIEEATKKKKQDFSRVEFLTYDEEIFVGFMVVRLFENMSYLFFLTIDSNCRSKGYGGKALKLLEELYPEKQQVVDFEMIDDKALNNEQRKTRRAFYIRNGYKETNKFISYLGVDYEIMCKDDDFDFQMFKNMMNEVKIKGFSPIYFEK